MMVFHWSYGGDDQSSSSEGNNCSTSSSSIIPSSFPRRRGGAATGILSSVLSLLDNQDASSDPLEYWLFNLKAFLPDETFEQGLFKMSLRDTQCTHFVVDSIQSNYTNNTSTIFVTISGIQGTCTGYYHAPLSSSGQVIASLAHDSTMELAIDFQPTTNSYMIQSASITYCDTSAVRVGGITFQGSISAKFINLFSLQIASHVNNAIQTLPCPSIQPIFHSYMNTTFTQVNDKILSIIQNGQPSIHDPHIHDDDDNKSNKSSRVILDWKEDTPLLFKMLNEINSLLSANLIAECGLINNLFNIMTNGSMNILLSPFNNNTNSILSTFNFTLPHYGNISIDLHSVNITGLTRFSNLTLFRPAKGASSDEANNNNNTREDKFHAFTSGISTRLFSQEQQQQLSKRSNYDEDELIHVSVGVLLHVYPDVNTVQDNAVLIENFTIHLDLSDVDIFSRLFLAMDRNLFELTRIGEVFDNQLLSPCFLQQHRLYSINFTDIHAILHLKNIHLKPTNIINNNSNKATLESGLDEMLNNFLALFISEYDLVVSDLLYGLVQGPLRSNINFFLSKEVNSSIEINDDDNNSAKMQRNCDYYSMPHPPDLFKFDSSPFIKWINDGFNSKVGLASINNAMECLSDKFVVKTTSSVTTSSGLSVRLKDMKIENVNSVYDFAIAVPEVDHYHINNLFGLGRCQQQQHQFRNYQTNDSHNTCNNPVIVNLCVELEDVSKEFYSQVNVSLTFGDWLYKGGIDIEFDWTKLYSLTMFHLFNEGYCSVVPFAKLQLYDVSVGSLGMLDIQLDVLTIVAGKKEVKKKITVVHGRDSDLVTMNEYIETASYHLQQVLNDASNPLLYQSPYICHQENIPPNNDQGKTAEGDSGRIIIGLNYFAVISLIIGASVILTRFLAHRRQVRQRGNLNYDDISSAMEPLLLSQEVVANNESNREMYGTKHEDRVIGLAFQSSIGNSLRYWIPMILIGTMSLFLSSNLSIGADLIPVAGYKDNNGGSSVIHLPTSFSFSLGSTLSGMFNAGVYVLMILILVFSGIWPYLKLFLMLLAWVLPPKILCPERRGRMLVWLDVLGKYSLVDSYVLILMMVGFSLHLELSKQYSLDLYVEPRYGFYSFLAATVISLVLGHVILYLHRRSLQLKKPYANVEYNTRESLMQHHFSVGSHNNMRRLVEMSFVCKILLLTLVFLSTALLVVGSLMQSFTFEIKGVTELLMDNGTKTVHTYSFVSLGQALTRSVEKSNALSIRLLQFFYYFFGLFTPLMSLTLLALLLCLPMEPKLQFCFLLCAEVANAWSGMEVFVLSIGVSLWQISRFAQFIVGTKCDLLNLVLKLVLNYELDGDAVCFDVHTSLNFGFCYLFFGVVFCCLSSYILLRLTHQSCTERLEGGADALEDDPQISDSSYFLKESSVATQYPSFVDYFPECIFKEIAKVSVTSEESLDMEVDGEEDSQRNDSSQIQVATKYTSFVDCFPDVLWKDIPEMSSAVGADGNDGQEISRHLKVV